MDPSSNNNYVRSPWGSYQGESNGNKLDNWELAKLRITAAKDSALPKYDIIPQTREVIPRLWDPEVLEHMDLEDRARFFGKY